MTEPMCCGEPMIHNTYTSEYECSDAYLTLHDAGIDPYLTDAADLASPQRTHYEHWAASRRPDTLAPAPARHPGTGWPA